MVISEIQFNENKVLKAVLIEKEKSFFFPCQACARVLPS